MFWFVFFVLFCPFVFFFFFWGEELFCFEVCFIFWVGVCLFSLIYLISCKKAFRSKEDEYGDLD